jgi:hypothetical protein
VRLGCPNVTGMRHVDMRKLPAAAQEERRRQVIGLRQRGMTYQEVADLVGLSRTGTSYPRSRAQLAAGSEDAWRDGRSLPDFSSIAPCSRRPGRCAPALRAGAAARPPGPRLRAALCRPAGRDGRMSALVEPKDEVWVRRPLAYRDRGRTGPAVAGGRRRPQAADRPRRAERGRRSGHARAGPRSGFGSSDRG